jgi:hypothetical protein
VKSNQIKAIVATANEIIKLGDKNLEYHETRNLLRSLLVSLATQGKKTPVFSMGIVQYLTHQGFMILEFDDHPLDQYLGIFGERIANLSDGERQQILKITEKLFQEKS